MLHTLCVCELSAAYFPRHVNENFVTAGCPHLNDYDRVMKALTIVTQHLAPGIASMKLDDCSRPIHRLMMAYTLLGPPPHAPKNVGFLKVCVDKLIAIISY